MADKRADERTDQKREPVNVPVRISLIYESKDGRFCLFQDAEGHLTSVSAARLA